MYGIKRRGFVKNVMIKNELLYIQQLYESEIAILMYKFQKRTLPIPIRQLFQLKPCQIKTRNDSQIISSYFKTTVCQQSIKFIGPKIWNSLPQEIKNCFTLVSFKNKLKVYYLTGAIPDESTKT